MIIARASNKIAWVDSDTGEFQEQRLEHSLEAEKFSRGLKEQGPKVRVGMEASGPARWFEHLPGGTVARYRQNVSGLSPQRGFRFSFAVARCRS